MKPSLLIFELAILGIAFNSCGKNPLNLDNYDSTNKIVYIRHVDYSTNLFTINIDGSDKRSLNNSAFDIRWSPRGDKIALFWFHQEEPEIYLLTIAPDGSDLRAVTPAVPEDKVLTGSLDWSPDGKKIVFFTAKYHNSGFAVVNTDGTGEINLTPEGFWVRAAWSPTGSKIALEGAPRGVGDIGIYVINADGTNMYRLVEGSSCCPVWSPDGERIAFPMTSRQAYSPDIYIANVDGSNLQRITHDENSFPADWSPDGKKFLYLFVPNGVEKPIFTSIGIMNIDGSSRKTLVEADNNHGHLYARFSPDGSKIAYVRNSNTGTEEWSSLWVMDVDGSNKTKLDGHFIPGTIQYDWSPFSK